MRIIILSAFQDELEIILQHFSDLKMTRISKCRCWTGTWKEHDVIIALSGIGTSSASMTTTLLCEKVEPDLIIFCGVAGGIGAHLQIADIVIANKVIDVDLHQLPAILRDTPYQQAFLDPHTEKNLTFEYPAYSIAQDIINTFVFDNTQTGTIATSNTFPSPKNLFGEIKQHQCIAIEMEGAGVCKVAEYYDVPVITMRAISNLLDEDGNDLGTSPDALKQCSERLAACLMQLLVHIESLNLNIITHQQRQIDAIINQYNLKQHPEGGWYRRTFCSTDSVTGNDTAFFRYKGEPRPAGSAILYLLTKHDFSAWHTVQSDETWFFHSGAAMLLRVINDSNELEEIIMGHDQGILQFTVRAGYVFSAESQGDYSLLSCAVTPGFDFRDFKLLNQQEFISKYPQHAGLVRLSHDMRNDASSETPLFNHESCSSEILSKRHVT